MFRRPASKTDTTSRPIVIVSDVSLGYGVPQLLSMARSLSAHYGCQVMLLEPDQLERPAIVPDDTQICIERVVTMGHPYSWAGRSEYCRQVRTRLETLKPQLLVLAGYYTLPAMLNIRHRPEFTILYMIEHVGTQAFELDLVKSTISEIDLLVFPETNRARIDLQRIQPPHTIKTVIMQNCAARPDVFVEPRNRNGRMFYGGTFHKTRTNAGMFLDPDIRKLPVDIFGMIQGFDDPSTVTLGLTGAGGGCTYRGYTPGGQPFFETLSRYSFSIVMWAPIDEATTFAAPNKLYDAIACGVPPFCAPHPLCIDIITRYGCGVLMDDWSTESFKHRSQEALRMIGSSAYDEMTERCRYAHQAELNWDAQFSNLLPHLPDPSVITDKKSEDGQVA